MQKSNFMKMVVLKFSFNLTFLFLNCNVFTRRFQKLRWKKQCQSRCDLKMPKTEHFAPLFTIRKLDCLQLRAKFLFSWLEKLADLLSWLEKQAQLNLGLNGAMLKMSIICRFLQARFRNSVHLLRLHQNWRKCIPNKILLCLEVRIFESGFYMQKLKCWFLCKFFNLFLTYVECLKPICKIAI